MPRIYKNKKDLITSLIKDTDIVLDAGFWGQGTKITDRNWVHNLLLNQARDVYGLDIDFDISKLKNKDHYKKANAENFDFDFKFDVIFAGDLIEHLPNPGLFLDACRRNLKEDGHLIITTPNCFNLYNIAGKFMNFEPMINSDHTCYFNSKTIKVLLNKKEWNVDKIQFLYTLGCLHKESFKKKLLNFIYYFLSKITSKYTETLVVVANKNNIIK